MTEQTAIALARFALVLIAVQSVAIALIALIAWDLYRSLQHWTRVAMEHNREEHPDAVMPPVRSMQTTNLLQRAGVENAYKRQRRPAALGDVHEAGSVPEREAGATAAARR